MYVPRKYRERAFDMAAESWNSVNRHHAQDSVNDRVRLAKQKVRRDALRRKRQRGGFGNILGPLLLSLLIKLAFKLIEKWAEERLFGVNKGDYYDG